MEHRDFRRQSARDNSRVGLYNDGDFGGEDVVGGGDDDDQDEVAKTRDLTDFSQTLVDTLGDRGHNRLGAEGMAGVESVEATIAPLLAKVEVWRYNHWR